MKVFIRGSGTTIRKHTFKINGLNNYDENKHEYRINKREVSGQYSQN